MLSVRAVRVLRPCSRLQGLYYVRHEPPGLVATRDMPTGMFLGLGHGPAGTKRVADLTDDERFNKRVQASTLAPGEAIVPRLGFAVTLARDVSEAGAAANAVIAFYWEYEDDEPSMLHPFYMVLTSRSVRAGEEIVVDWGAGSCQPLL